MVLSEHKVLRNLQVTKAFKNEFKARNRRLLTKLEKQGFRKKILNKTFVKFYRRHYDEVRY